MTNDERRGWPTIRLPNSGGGLAVRDGFVIAFFVPRPHREIAGTVRTALDECRAFMEDRFPRWYIDAEGDPSQVTPAAMASVYGAIAEWPNCRADFLDSPNGAAGTRVRYEGREEGGTAGAVSTLTVWLPTETATERVRSMALRLAELLPFSHGYASLAFNYSDGAGTGTAFALIRALCFHYPGMDVHRIDEDGREIGSRVRGAYWLNFFGGATLETLEPRLRETGLEIASLGDGKAFVAAGEAPRAGNLVAPAELAQYRAVARAVEPLLYRSSRPFPWFSAEETARWETRLL